LVKETWMIDRRVFWAMAAASVLAALALAGCAGSLPLPEAAAVAEAAGSDLEFTAPVDGMGPDVWSIGGLAVTIRVETEIAGDPKVGDLVRVQALLSPDGLSARQIEVVGAAAQAAPAGVPAPTDDEIEFVGPVAGIGSDTWVIGDRSVSITSQTEIKGAIVVGDMAKVHASLNDDQSLTAREIEPAQPDDLTEADDDRDDLDELEFKGIVESIDGETWTVGGLAFRVLPETEVPDVIAVGDFVEIHAVWSPDGILTAVRIRLEDNDASTVDDDLDDDDLDDQDDDEDDDENEDDEDEEDDVEDEHDGSDDDSGSGSGGD
jgi:hypothetical protein